MHQNHSKLSIFIIDIYIFHKRILINNKTNSLLIESQCVYAGNQTKKKLHQQTKIITGHRKLMVMEAQLHAVCNECTRLDCKPISYQVINFPKLATNICIKESFKFNLYCICVILCGIASVCISVSYTIKIKNFSFVCR